MKVVPKKILFAFCCVILSPLFLAIAAEILDEIWLRRNEYFFNKVLSAAIDKSGVTVWDVLNDKKTFGGVQPVVVYRCVVDSETGWNDAKLLFSVYSREGHMKEFLFQYRRGWRIPIALTPETAEFFPSFAPTVNLPGDGRILILSDETGNKL